jgi:tRNA A37 threonylcarbamoyladenosine biosynthesis protein TsaE
VAFDVMTHQVGTKCAEHVHSKAHTLGGAVGAGKTVLG